MPDSFGKRQRNANKAKKATAREDRRIARNKRRSSESESDESWLGDPPTPVADIPPRTRPRPAEGRDGQGS